MPEDTAPKPSGAKAARPAPPRQVEDTPAGTAEFVICNYTIEQCFEEAKTELGTDHYEVRTYLGWHHHMLTSMLAHFFLWHLKIRLGKKAPALTVSQLRVLLEVVLPKRTFTIEDVLALVTWMQRRNHRAYLSHRKRREAEG